MGGKNFAYGNYNNRFETFDVVDNYFVIRRESDNVEQEFTPLQITNGTYASFISGTNGFVKEWKNAKKKLTAFSNTYQPYLREGSGFPYVDFSVQGMCLETTNTLIIENDFISTIILNEELNQNNQRNNFALVGDSLVKFALQLSGTGLAGVVLNTAPSTNMTATNEWTVSNSAVFKIITITYIGGVLNLYLNNVLASTTTITYTIGVYSSTINKIILGGRGFDSALGKVNKYKHFSIRTGSDLSGYDFSTYTAAIMTKYGI